MAILTPGQMQAKLAEASKVIQAPTSQKKILSPQEMQSRLNQPQPADSSATPFQVLQNTQKKTSGSLLETISGGMRGLTDAQRNFIIGHAKGLLSSALGAAELGSKALESGYNVTLGKLTGARAFEGSKLAEEIKQSPIATPSGLAQKTGFATEQIGEFLVPTGEAELASAVASKITNPKLAKAVEFATKSLASGASQATRSAVQQGDLSNAPQNLALGAAMPTAEVGISTIGKLGAKSLGISTGAGEGSITQAFRDESPEFKKALRGDQGETMERVLGQSQDALQTIKNNRSAAYRSQLEAIKNTQVPVDLVDIKKSALEKIQKDYGVRIAENGDLDFSRSTISDDAEAGRIKAVLHNVLDWGSREGDNTVLGLDTLKRRLDDFWSPSSEVRGLISSLRNDVKKEITKTVPAYEDMTKGYAEATKYIKDIQQALSIKGADKTNADTAIRKLSSIFRENNELRKEFVNELSQVSGKNIMGEIAGAQLSSWMPKGLVAKLGAGGLAIANLANPSSIPALATASPRVVGEFINILGKSYRGIAQPLAGPLTRGVASTAEQK